MTIKQQIEKLGLPLDQVIVTGSGLLDQLGLRSSNDLDILVNDAVFEQMRASGLYDVGYSEPDEYCRAEGFEAFRTWFGDSFSELEDETIILDGVKFLNIDQTINWKRKFGRDNDLEDIQLLEDYREQTS